MKKNQQKKDNEQDSQQFSIQEVSVISESVKQAHRYSDKKLSDKFRDISWIIVGVVIVVFIAFIQMIVNLSQINNAAYKEYTQRLEERNEFLNDYKEQVKMNNELLRIISSQSAEKK